MLNCGGIGSIMAGPAAAAAAAAAGGWSRYPSSARCSIMYAAHPEPNSSHVLSLCFSAPPQTRAGTSSGQSGGFARGLLPAGLRCGSVRFRAAPCGPRGLHRASIGGDWRRAAGAGSAEPSRRGLEDRRSPVSAPCGSEQPQQAGLMEDSAPVRSLPGAACWAGSRM